MSHHKLLVFLGRKAFAENALRFPAVHDLCSRKTGQNRVSRTVRKQLCFIFGLFARENVGADDGAKAFAVHFNAGHALVEADIFVIAAIVKGKPLAVVLIVRRVKNGRMSRNRRDLFYHVAEVFIRRKVDPAAHAHANLRAVAAAKRPKAFRLYENFVHLYPSFSFTAMRISHSKSSSSMFSGKISMFGSASSFS